MQTCGKKKNKNDYYEAYPHLLFFAFAHRVVNGGGRIHREYALGSDSCDVMIEKPYGNGKTQYEIIEIKRRRQRKDMTLDNLMTNQWLPQLAKYLHCKGLEKGYMFVFDLSTNEQMKHETRNVEFEGKEYTVQVYYMK